MTTAADETVAPHEDARRAAGPDRRQALGLLWRAARPDKREIGWGTLWLAVAGLLDALGPLFGKRFIDDYLLPRNFDVLAIALLIGGYLVTGWAASIIRYFQLVRLSGLAMRSVRRLREGVYGHVMRLPMAFFDRAITGQLVSRITNDTESIKQLYTQVLFEALVGLTVLFGVVMAMLWLDWRLMLIVLLLVPATAVIVWGYQRLSADAVTRSRELRSDINAQMAEGIAGMSVLQATGAVDRFATRFADTNRAHYEARMGEVRANAWLLRPALDFVNILLIVIIVAAVGTKRIDGVEIGLLYAFIAYVTRVVEPLIQITLQFSMLQQAIVAASRVNALLQEGEAPRIRHDRRVEAGQRRAHRRDVRLRPAAAGAARRDARRFRPAASSASSATPAAASPRCCRCCCASTRRRRGASRSTASRWTRSGTTTFARTSASCRRSRSCSPPARARTSTWAGGCRPTRSSPRRAPPAPTASSRRSNKATTRRWARAAPGLSSGQKQLIAVARALAGRPRVLFLDEATSRIDSETEQRVQAALAELHGSTTVIAIAHRLSTIRAADSIVVLNHGRIAEQGTHDALMAIEGGLYQRLYLLQQIGE